MVISAESAKVGAECKLTVKAVKNGSAGFSDTADAIVVAKVVADAITVSVDEDEDLPVIYSGVNVKNEGIQMIPITKLWKLLWKNPQQAHWMRKKN